MFFFFEWMFLIFWDLGWQYHFSNQINLEYFFSILSKNYWTSCISTTLPFLFHSWDFIYNYLYFLLSVYIWGSKLFWSCCLVFIYSTHFPMQFLTCPYPQWQPAFPPFHIDPCFFRNRLVCNHVWIMEQVFLVICVRYLSTTYLLQPKISYMDRQNEVISRLKLIFQFHLYNLRILA